MTSSRTSQARQAANFDGPGKILAREHNLTIVRNAVGLLTNDTQQLRCDWVELAGESVRQSVALLEGTKLLRPGGFIGVDTNQALIEQLRHERPDLKWRAGDLLHHIPWLCTHAEVGVLNFDGYFEVGGTRASAMLPALRPLICRGIKLFGSFVLILNNCLDSAYYRRIQPSEALRRQTAAVVEGLRGYYPRRELCFDSLLPGDFDTTRVDDRRYEGPAGAYWIYAGKRYGGAMSLRMAKLGLEL